MRLIATAVAIACLTSTTAMATDYKAGPIEIVNPWSRATPKGASAAIGYMAIRNNGTAPDRLIGGSIEVAADFELHSMVMENGIAKMRELRDVEIKPGQTIDFKPGGSHVMFVNLKHPLIKGEHVKGTLVFQHAGTVQIEYNVEGIGAQSAPMEMERMQH
jgi:copper(I)-binding protein